MGKEGDGSSGIQSKAWSMFPTRAETIIAELRDVYRSNTNG